MVCSSQNPVEELVDRADPIDLYVDMDNTVQEHVRKAIQIPLASSTVEEQGPSLFAQEEVPDRERGLLVS